MLWVGVSGEHDRLGGVFGGVDQVRETETLGWDQDSIPALICRGRRPGLVVVASDDDVRPAVPLMPMTAFRQSRRGEGSGRHDAIR